MQLWLRRPDRVIAREMSRGGIIVPRNTEGPSSIRWGCVDHDCLIVPEAVRRKSQGKIACYRRLEETFPEQIGMFVLQRKNPDEAGSKCQNSATSNSNF